MVKCSQGRRLLLFECKKIAFICSFLCYHYYLSTLTLYLAKKWIELLGEKKRRGNMKFSLCNSDSMVMGSERRFSNRPNLGGKCNYDTIGMMYWKIVLSGKQMPNLYMHMNTWVRMAYHIIACMPKKWPNTSSFRPLDCGFELKRLWYFWNLVQKRKGTSSKWEVNGLLQSWNQLLPHGKRMLYYCRQHFPCWDKVFPWHILCCLLCAKSQVHQFVTNYQTFYYVQISVFSPPQFYDVATMAIVHKEI